MVNFLSLPSRFLRLFAAQFLLLSICFSAFASDESVSNTDIINRIEKSLVFDKESRQVIDFYKNDNSKKKSAISIDKISKLQDKKTSNPSDPKSEEDSENFKITVVESKKNINDLREKERMAYNYALIGQYEVSIQLLKAVLAEEPDNSYDNFALATIYQKIGQNRQAKKIYYELLKADIDNKEEVVFNLLNIIADESPREAIATTQRLILQNPNKDYLFSIAGQSYEKLGDYQNSLKMFDKAYNLDDKNIRYAYNLAVMSDLTKNYQKAFELYKKVADKHDGRGDISLEKIKDRIEQIKKLI